MQNQSSVNSPTANIRSLTPTQIFGATGALGLLGIAFVLGLIQGPGANDTVGNVLGVQSTSTSWVSNIGNVLPFGFAFVAGMVAAVNPCGFVMLPAYLTIYLRDNSDVEDDAGLAGTAKRGVKAVYVSLAMGMGFVALFGSAGLVVSASQELVKDALPWIGLSMGILMGFLGAYILLGGKIYAGLGQRMAGRVGDPRVSSLGGYFLFGVSYALASLSCTLPIFLSVVTSSFGREGFHRWHGAVRSLRWRDGVPDNDRDDRRRPVQERDPEPAAEVDALRRSRLRRDFGDSRCLPSFLLAHRRRRFEVFRRGLKHETFCPAAIPLDRRVIDLKCRRFMPLRRGCATRRCFRSLRSRHRQR